jgi:hypothetical protein
MPHNILKARVLLLHLRMYHGSLWRWACTWPWRTGCTSLLIGLISTLVILVIIPSATLVRKVRRALMLMCATIVLKPPDDLVDV